MTHNLYHGRFPKKALAPFKFADRARTDDMSGLDFFPRKEHPDSRTSTEWIRQMEKKLKQRWV